jgi:cystatin-A/B
MRLAGGQSDIQPVTNEITELVKSLQTSIEYQLKETFTQFNAIEYRVQVVAGLIYHVKIRISDDSDLHVKLFEPLPYTQETTQVLATRKVNRETPSWMYFR